MKIHFEAKPNEHSFIKELKRSADRRRLAEVLRNQLYDLDWAAVYIKDKQYMFFDKQTLIDALQFDKYDYGTPDDLRS